ncbi:hypothetical protein ACWDSJ_20650 [Nocardia sp. NPDC003482]
MVHFAVTVALAGETGSEDLERVLAEVLAPFDENLVVPRYVKFTKAELIAHRRLEILEYRDTLYAEYISDPEAYRAKHVDYPQHVEHLRKFPEQLRWSDEQVYADAVRFESRENIGPAGEVYSEDNPQGHWDFWILGGRYGGRWTLVDDAARESSVGEPWRGVDAIAAERSLRAEIGLPEDPPRPEIGPRATDLARLRDIDPASHEPSPVLLTLDRVWHEREDMWRTRPDAPIKWARFYWEQMALLPPDTWLANVDCHV